MKEGQKILCTKCNRHVILMKQGEKLGCNLCHFPYDKDVPQRGEE